MHGRPIPDILVRAASPPGTDADLLGRFVTARDAGAFAELVSRHGPMVLGVCRRALGDTPDADDAFQAVWLVLVRKAETVSPRGKVGHWLYGVAVRTAAHARALNAKRIAARRELPDVPDPRPAVPGAGEEATVIDAELAKLPDKYRAAVVLCELEGRPLKDVAECLGVPLGTVASRLARGRALLAERLKARGFAASVAAALAAAGGRPVSARLVELALAPVAGPGAPGTVSELARGVLHAMFTQKLFGAVRVAVAVALCATTAGLAAWGGGAGAQPGGKPRPPAAAFDEGNKYGGLLDPKLPRRTWQEIAWERLALDEPHATRAVLDFAARPDDAVEFFKANLQPLKADRDQIKKLIADLASESDAVWKPAFDRLNYLDPALALAPDTALAEAKTPLAKQRLAAVLTNIPDPKRFAGCELSVRFEPGAEPQFQYQLVATRAEARGPGAPASSNTVYGVESRVSEVRRPAWVRATRAVVLLDHSGHNDALALLKDMAAGHPDAPATRAAKEAVARLTAPAP
ncbi:MAG: sigma-70 family RNA polymerase sigma factor [Planctomycetes bacterium]|nr:sigma-70 family RNA polymerase sigma factor [Planctomycetota bacterium]